MSLRFPSSSRLLSRAEFTAVQDQGRRVASRFFTLLAMPNTLDHDRLGIIASRRLGGAVIRNRAKRVVREIFRRQEPGAHSARHPGSFDLVVIPKRELLAAPVSLVERDFRAAFGRIDRAHPR